MDRITYLIEKFWQGKATEGEKKEILRYLEQHDSRWKARMKQEFLMDEVSGSDMDKERVEQIFARIQAVADINEEERLPFMHRIRPFVRIAAAAVVLILFGWAITVYRSDGEPVQTTVSTVPPVLDTMVYKNLGEKERTILLEDGSKVLLTSGSSIAYVPDFDVNKRDIFLEGEATFEVAKDTLRPFTVWAEGYSTTALGTAFTVSAHHAEVFKVNLISGKVVVRSSHSSTVSLSDVYLEPGEELSINPFSGLWAVSGKTQPPMPVAKKKVPSVRPDPVPDDISDELVFDKTPLDQVFGRIAKKYDVSIDLSNVDVSQLSFTGNFEPSNMLDSMIAIICNMNDLTYYTEDNTIRIKKND